MEHHQATWRLLGAQLVLTGSMLASPLGDATGQALPQDLTPGTTVRFVRRDSRFQHYVQHYTGVFLGAPSDSHLVVRLRSGDTLRLIRQQLVSLERSVGQRRQTLTGLLIGLGLAGAVATAGSRQDQCRTERARCFGEAMILIGIPAGGLGALIGSRIRADRWRAVPF